MSAELHYSLVRHLLSEKRYGDAIKLAKLPNYSGESADNAPMLLAVLAEESLSELQRAEVTWEYGDVLRLTGSDVRWRELLETAARLYSKAGHATGALDTRIDLIRHGRDGNDSVAEDTAELWHIMETMESVGNWASVSRCLEAIIDVNSAEFNVPPESLQVKIEEEWLRVEELRGTKVASVFESISAVLEWQSRKAHPAKSLGFLERFYEKVKDSDALTVIGIVISALHIAYQSIGDNDKANEVSNKSYWDVSGSQTAPEALETVLPNTQRRQLTQSVAVLKTAP